MSVLEGDFITYLFGDWVSHHVREWIMLPIKQGRPAISNSTALSHSNFLASSLEYSHLITLLRQIGVFNQVTYLETPYLEIGFHIMLENGLCYLSSKVDQQYPTTLLRHILTF